MSALFAVTPAQAAARPAALTINWTILLSGPSFNGENPTGNSDYEVENGAVKFSADCDNVNLADGTMLNVLVNGKTVGSFALQGGGGALLLTGSGTRSPQRQRRYLSITTARRLSRDISNEVARAVKNLPESRKLGG